jgi:hypothetical protein
MPSSVSVLARPAIAFAERRCVTRADARLDEGEAVAPKEKGRRVSTGPS